VFRLEVVFTNYYTLEILLDSSQVYFIDFKFGLFKVFQGLINRLNVLNYIWQSLYFEFSSCNYPRIVNGFTQIMDFVYGAAWLIKD
jgi:hypothetical protein